MEGCALSLSLRRAGEVFGGHTATVFQGHKRTWAEVADRAARLAAGLRSLGLADGDRIGALALNSDDFLELFFATWIAGGVIVPMNTRWSVPENVYALNDSGVRLLVMEEAFQPQAQAFLEQTAVEKIVQLGGPPQAGIVNTEDLIRDHEPTFDAGRGGGDLAAIFYTGGTTGFPKGVMLSHEGLIVSSLGFAPVISADQNMVNYSGPPFFHMAAGAFIVMVTMFAGTHVILDRFDPVAALTTMTSEKITHMTLVPAMVGMILDHLSEGDFDTSSLKVLGYGASPMPETVLRNAIAAFPKTQFVQAYGQTELSPFATALPHEDHDLDGPNVKRLKSAGKAVPNCEVEVVDPNGKSLPPGEVGEVRVRGPNVMIGYWNKPDQTAATIVDGWCSTGDAGYFDEDRYLYIVDRVKDMIISGGENVYSAEVENAVMKHPAVGTCAVIGIPSDKWGEEVHAVVVPKDGATLEFDDLYAHCKELIAGYKCPRSMTLRIEPLPLSAAGKVLKRDLRAPFWEGKTRGVN